MSTAAKEYMINKIKTATPLELVVIAYDNAILNLESARQELADSKMAAAGEHIIKAQKFIRELRNALDMSVEDVSGMLFAMYRAMDKQLAQASVARDAEKINKIIEALRELRDTWEQLNQQTPADKQRSSNDGRDYNYVNVYR